MSRTNNKHWNTITLTLGVLACLAGNSSYGQSLFADPLFGLIELNGGWLPDPHVVQISAGGATDISGQNLGSNCTGYITDSQPDLNLNLSSGLSQIGIYVKSSVDTTLLVNKPDGTWICSDDASFFSNSNPGLQISSPADGVYKIWVGTYSAIDATDATIAITEFDTSDWDAQVLEPTTSQNIPQSGVGRHDEIVLDNAFFPDPLIIEIEAGGAMAVDDLGAACSGYIAGSRPDVNVNYQGTANLGFYINSAVDTTLVIKGPNGNWFCSDDFGLQLASNPGVFIENATSGNYAVWVGTFSENSNSNALLAFSEWDTDEWLSTLSLDPTPTPTPAPIPTPPVIDFIVPQPGSARYGEISLAAYFSPDPHVVNIVAGGNDNVDSLGANCLGYLDGSQPTVNVRHDDGGTDLGFLVAGSMDSTLVIQDPSGNWHCNDDSAYTGNTDAAILFEGAGSGNYSVWVGTLVSPAAGGDARLVVTEQATRNWQALDLDGNRILGDTIESLEIDDPGT